MAQSWEVFPTEKNWYVVQAGLRGALDWNNGNRVKFIQGAKYKLMHLELTPIRGELIVGND